MLKPIAFALLGLAVSGANLFAAGPEPLPLWPDGAPGAVGKEPADIPELRVYLPEEKVSTGAGVVICPGGGYGILATDHEGHQVAKWFNTIGVAGFVLKYRHAPKYQHPSPLLDAQRALRMVRANAKKWNVSSDRIGIMGFSAGGHLASTVATHFDSGDDSAEDPIDRKGCRPDFAILGYPVISMTEPWGHAGSRRNLLGNDPSNELAELLSNEKQVTAETPRTFLFHTEEDRGVPVENSLAFFAALRKAKVPAELHVYQPGPHGLGLAPGSPALSGWKDRLADWMRASNLLAAAVRAEISGKVTVNGEPLRFGQITFLPPEPHQPAAFAPINRGNYRLSAENGPVVGKCRVEIRNLGDVAAFPTIEDVEVLPMIITVEIKPGANNVDFDAGR